MKWTKDKSIKLSIACVGAFAFILAVLDVWCLLGFGLSRNFPDYWGAPLIFWPFAATVASGSVCAWICLWDLYRLLKNLQAEQVFTEANTLLLRHISWCCAGAAVVCLLSTIYAWPFVIVAIAAAFMMLIVRIVKNCFEQAIDMKSELDLTI